MPLEEPFLASVITTGTNRVDDDDYDGNEEQVAKAVFLRLDPVLGVLLKLIQQYQATIQAERAILTQSNSQSPHQASSISQLQERVLSMLQTQCVVLDRLRQLLQDLPSSSSSSSQQQYQQLALSDQQVGRSLVILWEYLSLPLLAVLRGTTKGQADWSVLLSSSSSSNEQQQEQIRIRQSASWKCIERAARTLTVTLQLVHKGNQRLSNKVTMSALIPCTTALPSGREIAQSNGNGNENDNSGSGSSTTLVAVGATMDRGEDSCAAILEAIATLAVPCSSQQQAEHTESLAQHITGALGGALVARVVDSCVALIAPDQPKEPSTVLLSQALKTVKAFMNAIPIPRVWRGVFPGCFAGLYRRLLHSLRVGKPSLSGVVVEGIHVLCLLLQQSLQPSSETQAAVATTTESVVADLQSLALVANSSTSSTDEPKDDMDLEARGDVSAFLVQAKQRLPAPLTVLVNLLRSARSPAVRKQATGLFRTILVDTRACWVGTADAFMLTAMEACLVLSNDRDDDISSAARAVLKDYLISSDSNQDINVLVLPRILTLIEELPILAQRLKDAELRTKLTLLSGYLSMNTTSKVASKKLRTSLVSGPISITIRNALTSMVDVDFESFEPRAANAIVVANDNTHHTVRRPLGPPLRHMTRETKEVAVNMLRSLGKALGPKYTAVFVDACIADLFEACVSRVESRVSLVGKSQTEWLHERIGSILVVQEMLIGAFAKEPEGPGASKRDQKRSRILTDLASSILPIMISSPLYDLPTYLSHQGADVVNEKGATSQVGSLVALDNARGHGVLSAALRGNASISFYLLGVTGTIFDLLGRAGYSFLPLVLHPVLGNIGSRNILLNQDMAFHVLESFVTSCGYENMTDLLTDNMDNLMGTLMGRIRVSGGRSLGKAESDDDTITVVSTVTAMLRIAAGSSENTQVCERSFSPSMLSYIEELVTALIARFDHQAAESANQRETVTAFVQLFDAALTHVACWYKYIEDKNPASTVSESSKEAWLALLDPFRIDKERGLFPEESFELYRDPHVQDKGPAIGFQLVSASEIEFVKRIISRCCFLLSHPSLTSQIQSCAALVRGFSFLGAVARRVCPDVDEPNGSSTAILRQVSVSWPAISARLKAASSNVRVSRGTSLLVVQPSSQRYATSLPTNIGEQRVFLSKLFELVAVMTVCADDFMASRFRQDVWPCIVQVLGSFATSRQGLLSTEPQSFPSPIAVSLPVNQKCVVRAQKLSASELGLALGIIQCLARVFGHRPSGLVLAGLIPLAGSMLFPFLESSDDDDTQKTLEAICMTALKNMVLIDSDALWRSLMDLSARGLPPSPLGVLAATKNVKEQALGGTPDSVLAKKANELIGFIEALPEQNLG